MSDASLVSQETVAPLVEIFEVEIPEITGATVSILTVMVTVFDVAVFGTAS